MKKILLFSLCGAVFCIHSAFSGNFSDLKSKHISVFTSSDEYINVGNGLYVECDDDEGDAGAKVVALWDNNSDFVESKRCFISGSIVGNDKWIAAEDRPNYCTEACTPPKTIHNIPGTHNWVVCVDGTRKAKELGDTVFIEGGSSPHSGCIYKICSNGQEWSFTDHKCIEKQSSSTPGQPEPQPQPQPQPDKSQAQLDCEAAAARGEPANWTGTACNCGDKYVWNVSQKKCITKDSSGGGTGGSTNSCLNRCTNLSGTQKSECAACCVVPSSVAKWNGAKCVCTADASYVFDIQTLQCNPVTTSQPQPQPQPIVQVYDCDSVKLQQLAQWRVQYANNAEIVAAIDAILAYCSADGRLEVVFLQMYSEVQALIANATSAVAAQQTLTEQRRSTEAISSAKKKLESLAEDFDQTVWKDAEGKFNTSRLASDSVAAVVLGTAGGLITSNVVKKNQVKNGFEDIQCTIGGQVVADWGDQFRVGIK